MVVAKCVGGRNCLYFSSRPSSIAWAVRSRVRRDRVYAFLVYNFLGCARGPKGLRGAIVILVLEKECQCYDLLVHSEVYIYFRMNQQIIYIYIYAWTAAGVV